MYHLGLKHPPFWTNPIHIAKTLTNLNNNTRLKTETPYCLCLPIRSDRNRRSHALYLIQTRISNSKALRVELSERKKPVEEMRKRYIRNEINNKKDVRKETKIHPVPSIHPIQTKPS